MPKQLTKVMTIEAAKRAAYEAKKKGTADVEVPHFEKVLAQLVRFFEIHLKQTPLLCVCGGGRILLYIFELPMYFKVCTLQ